MAGEGHHRAGKTRSIRKHTWEEQDLKVGHYSTLACLLFLQVFQSLKLTTRDDNFAFFR